MFRYGPILEPAARLAWAFLFAAAAPALAGQNLILGGVPVSGYVAVSMDAAGAQRATAWGAAELSPDGVVVRPLSVDSAVRIASVSKLAVAIALHRLQDQGRLALDDDAARHLGWRLRNPAHPDTPITLRQLLRHEASLADAGGYSFPLGVRLRDQLGPASFSPAAPGTAFDYANLGYAILGEVIEAVTGQRFDGAMDLIKLGRALMGKGPGFLSDASLASLMTPAPVKAGGAGDETDTYAITGTGIAPATGARSRFNAAEEAVFEKLAGQLQPPGE